MRFLLLLATLINFSINCFGQEGPKYPSKEEDKYWKDERRNFNTFHPTPVSQIKKVHYDFVSVRKSKITGNPFLSVFESTIYEGTFDSLIGGLENYFGNISADSSGNTRSAGMDSLFKLDSKYSVGGISKYLILRIDSLKSKYIIVYKDNTLEDREWGYWIAISNDKGINWKKYYTGLTANYFYYIKPKTQINLIKNDSIIQFEIAIVRKTKEEILPTSPPEFELVEDNLIMDLNLNKIILDKDSDGLSDIFEKKIFTNPLLKDTDNDGIEDSVDCNPRFPNIKNKYTNLYRILLEQPMEDVFIPFDDFNFKLNKKNESENEKIFLIVTDDKNLMHLTGVKSKYILMSSKEYDSYRKQNPNSLDQLIITPMFQVDDKQNYKKIDIYGSFWSINYLIIEKENGWFVQMIGQSII